MNEIRLYFEGHKSLRPGFYEFFSELRRYAKEKGWRFHRLVACGARAVDDFRYALQSHPEAWNILLMDSEGPDNGNLFYALRRKHRLNADLKDSVFWMVQLMEAWFLADLDALTGYYGQGFKVKILRGNPDVEQTPKDDVMRRLAAATRNTQKGKYDDRTKTTHAPDLLARIRPERVKRTSRNCKRMFDTVLSRMA